MFFIFKKPFSNRFMTGALMLLVAVAGRASGL